MERAIKPDYLNHRRRMKKKYMVNGISGWQDYEILEFVLFYAISRIDTKPIAKELLARFKTINGVLDADRKDLEEIKGISKHTAIFLKLLKDMCGCYLEKGLYDRDLLSSPQLVYDYLKVALKGNADEEFKVLFLNSRNRLLALETVQRGTVNKSSIYPRKVVERALYHHAVSVIVAHNHPGESLKPSADDGRVTQAIAQALKTVDVTLLDHIIIGGNGYFSFKEQSTGLGAD